MRDFQVTLKEHMNSAEIQRAWETKIAPRCGQIIEAYRRAATSESGEFVNTYGFTYLLRGSKSPNLGNINIKQTIQNRKPKDTAELVHDQLNKLIKRAGFIANRENSIFTTSDESFARSYGQYTALIFPMDGFDFLWSKRFSDLFENYVAGSENLTFNNLHQFSGPYYKYTNFFLEVARALSGDARAEEWGGVRHIAADSEEEKISKMFRTLSQTLFNFLRGAHMKMSRQQFLALLEGTKQLVMKYNNRQGKTFTEIPKTKVIQSLDLIHRLVRRVTKLKDEDTMGRAREQKILRELELSDRDLPEAILSGHEVLIHGNCFSIPREYKGHIDMLMQGKPASGADEV